VRPEGGQGRPHQAVRGRAPALRLPQVAEQHLKSVIIIFTHFISI
jgi:hypothetical protein